MSAERVIRIKVVDGRGRTVRRVSKRSYFDARMAHEHTEPWTPESKPDSGKWLKRVETENDPPVNPGRMVDYPDHEYLSLPGGLPLRLEKVAAVLERLALTLGLVDESGVVLVTDFDAATLSVAELRSHAHK
jgi:hypothetical protein